MSSRDIDTSKNILLQNLQTINKSDTISQFVDKCNHNFSKIIELGGGTAGVQGEQGAQGVPVKPKVPIHAWREGSNFEYRGESTDGNGGYIMVDIYEDLTDEKYQMGHLIILQNGHVYILKENRNTFDLTPIFIFAMQSFDTNTIIDGKSAYLHIAYADNVNGDNLVIDQKLNGDSNETSTFNLMRNVSNVNSNNVDEKPYMGIYSDFEETSSTNPERYTWIRIQGRDGNTGANGYKGDKGDKGDTGSAPSCVGVEMLGYSLNQIDIDSDEWVDSLDDLSADSEQISTGQKIYILNKYTWSDGNTTKGITVTLAGTQGDNGKSRVLFYLGSFKKGSATLTGTSVTGKLNDERCDYYIDDNGQAWMRIGSNETATGYADSTKNNSSDLDWKEAETVGFLQAGAITADMINVQNLVTSDAFVDNLKVTNANIYGQLTADKIDVTNLTVNAANITGTLTIGSDSSDSENEGVSLNGTLSSDNIGDGAITTTKIQDGAITADKIAAGAITADKIDTSKLSATEINTTPNSSDTIGRISILNNDIDVYSSTEEKMVLKITGDKFTEFANIPSIEEKSLNISAATSSSSQLNYERYYYIKLATIEIPSTGFKYSIDSLSSFSHTVKISASGSQSAINMYYQIYSDCVYVLNGNKCPTHSEKSISGSNMPFSINFSDHKIEDITCNYSMSLSKSNLENGKKYDIYCRYRFPYVYDTGIYVIISYDTQTINYKLSPDVDSIQNALTCIASNGLRFVKSANEYFELNDLAHLSYITSNGNYGFKINNSGFKIIMNGKTYNITISNGSFVLTEINT